MLSTYKKPALVLIISIVLFTGTIFLLDFEPLDFIRTHFYNPSFVKSIVKENEKASEIVQKHIVELQNKFSDTLNEPSVKSSFLYNQTAADIFERSKVFGILVESVSGLQSVQFVDSNGVRLHYSTSNRDVINISNNSATYRNYTDDSRALPYSDISVKANEKSKYTMDESHDRIIFSFPFFDSMDVYRGTALFTLSVRALAEKLVAEGSLKPTDDVSVIRLPRGIVFGSPNTSKSVILDKISSVWTAGYQEYITFDAEDSGVRYALITTKSGNDLFFGRIVNDSIFTISPSMKFIFQFSMFLTLFLTLFFLSNLKPHPVTLVENRIKALRSNLFDQLYIKKSGQDRAKWILELEQRRDEIRHELKSRIRIKRSLESKIDGIIDKAWDELLAVMKSGYDLASLEEIVKNRAVKIEKPTTPEKAETAFVEEIGDLEDETSSAPGAASGAASDGEVDALEEVGPVEETLVEEAEALEEADEIDEIDEFEEAGETESLEDEDVEEAEEIAEVEGAEEIEEIEEIGEAEEPKDVEEIQLSPGLLKAANKTLSKIKKDEASEAKQKKKGLLKSAAEIKETKKAAPKPEHEGRNGLLNLAAGFLNSIETDHIEEDVEDLEEIEELEEIETHEEPEEEEEEEPHARGLLAAATTYDRHRHEHAALAADNFSVREIDSDETPSEPEEEGQGLLLDMEVFSPFSSMFNSLDEEKEN